MPVVHVNNPYTTRWARCYDRLFCTPPLKQSREGEEHTALWRGLTLACRATRP